MLQEMRLVGHCTSHLDALGWANILILFCLDYKIVSKYYNGISDSHNKRN